jgi:hypothetical protein
MTTRSGCEMASSAKEQCTERTGSVRCKHKRKSSTNYCQCHDDSSSGYGGGSINWMKTGKGR